MQDPSNPRKNFRKTPAGEVDSSTQNSYLVPGQSRSASDSQTSARGVLDRSAQPTHITYEEYMSGITGEETIIDVDDASRLDTFMDATGAAWRAVKDRGGRVYSKVGRNTITAAFATFALLIIGMITNFGGLIGDENSVSSEQVRSATTVRAPGSTRQSISIFDSPSRSVENPISYDSSTGLATYVDTIDGVGVTVSQQQLTTEQLTDAYYITDVATSLGAQSLASTDKGVAYYSPPNSGAGLQSVVFVSANLLISLRAEGDSLTSTSIADYINALQLATSR